MHYLWIVLVIILFTRNQVTLQSLGLVPLMNLIENWNRSCQSDWRRQILHQKVSWRNWRYFANESARRVFSPMAPMFVKACLELFIETVFLWMEERPLIGIVNGGRFGSDPNAVPEDAYPGYRAEGILTNQLRSKCPRR